MHNGHLPSGWKIQRLDQISTIIDSLHKTPSYVPCGYPMIRVTDVKGGFLDTSNTLRVSQEVFAEFTKRYAPRKGDIVLSRVGTYGRASYVATEEPICLGQNTVVISPSLNSRFVHLCLESALLTSQIEKAVVGSTQKTISLKNICSLKVPLPPDSELEAIAHILGTLDDKIELNRQMNQTLEAMAQALFRSWFVDFDPVRAKSEGRQPVGMDAQTAALFPDSFEDSALGPIPKGWEVTDIGTEVEFLTGYAFKSKHFSESPLGVRLARGDNVKEGSFHWESKTRFWTLGTKEYERYFLKSGDVLIGMDGSKVGKNWVRVRECDLPCLLVQRVARLRQSSAIGPGFLWLLISHPGFRQYVEAVKTGTSIPHISGKQIKEFPFSRPPARDDCLFHKFKQQVAAFLKQQDANDMQNQTLSGLRDALLPKLLSGEIRVKDAETFVEKST